MIEHPEIKLKEIQEYYENIIGLLPGHVYWKDKNGVFQGCNNQQAYDAGFNSAKEVIGKTDKDMPWGQQADYLFDIDTQVMDLGEAISLEEDCILPDGTKKVYLSNKVPLRNKSNEVIGILGISFDITEKKLIETALKKAEGQIEGMKLVSASIAHELRTPLASIIAGSEAIAKHLPTLLQAYDFANEQKMAQKSISKIQLNNLSNVLTYIKEEAQQANLIMNMLLTSLSWESEKNKRPTQKISIYDCIVNALKSYVFPSGQEKLVHIDDNDSFDFLGDETLFIHIIFNLLKNSLYFITKMKKGEIYIYFKPCEEYNEMHFKDTAQGINSEYLPKIFDQFYTRDTHHGTGIGLAFCNTVMKSWDGQIIAQSVYGEFIEFIFQFPKIVC